LCACAAIAIIAAPGRTQAVQRGVFWAAVIVPLLALYLPGLPREGGVRPTPTQLLWFIAVYVGSPVGSYIDYRFTDLFHLFTGTALNGSIGVVLIAGCVALALPAWRARRAGDAGALFFLACAVFVGLSAAATAWGRAAFDEFGVANANASRYTIFSSYLLFGVIYYIAGRRTRLDVTRGQARLTRVWATALGAAVVVCGALTYWRSIPVYRSAYEYNRQLSDPYARRRMDPDRLDRTLFPDPAFSRFLRERLDQYQLGPYRDRPSRVVGTAQGLPRIGELAAEPGTVVTQRLAPADGGLTAVEVLLHAPGSWLPDGFACAPARPSRASGCRFQGRNRTPDWATRFASS
jgi:hypothetical protein